MDYVKEQAVKDKNAHKEARFAVWYFNKEFSNQQLGAMQFYEQYLNESDRELCSKAVKEISASRDKLQDEK